MEFVDLLITIFIVGAFFYIIASRVYQHEKESLDPMIAKIKGWFVKEESAEDMNSTEEYSLDFKGKVE